ncbi:helix-turn-helix domain-containing protein [Nocardia pseudobrasiliensis]|uniref:AraC-like DNA-binding protein n=1 Tax=Nocardia pseudobrasiliensis TaxID=45979 RepID=A0A370HMM0_9NOCA|nr:helix-turn-helix domain-containing protein [Nocardia pseudobrasiliensis]RDI59739.1 AraC-like DNA-binding protein [Nocardia pseudobrasiliensis]
MATVLNSDLMDPRDRAEAISTAVQEAAGPSYFAPATPGGQIRARFEMWRLGSIELRRALMSGFTVVRTAKQIRQSPAGMMSFNVQHLTSSRVVHAGTRAEYGPEQMFGIDFDLPYEVEWSGGRVSTLLVPLDGLGVPVDTVHSALRSPRRSPLYGLLVDHLEAMVRSADALEADPAAGQLGEACVDLVRAFLLSAVTPNAADGTALPEDVLLSRIRDHVDRHLADPELGPSALAQAHNISVRYLYKLCNSAGLSLEQWIIGQRLEHARAELEHRDARHRSIAAIAYASGFRDPSHFARRFRNAFGATPSEWRRENGC